MQAELISDLSSIHSVWQILLVCEDQKKSVSEFVLVQHSLQLFASLDDTVTIIAIDDEDDALSILEVMPPQRPDLVLTTYIPHCELNVLILDCLNVEAFTIRGQYVIS